MVKRSEIVNLGGLWLKDHGLSVASEMLGLFSRVWRVAPSHRTQVREFSGGQLWPRQERTLTMLRGRPSA